MNKKQLYILSLLLSLMFVLVLMQQFFLEDIRNVAMRNNSVKKFSEYRLNEGEYKVLLPMGWSIEEGIDDIDDKELEVKFNSDKVYGNITILNNIHSIEDVDTKEFNDFKDKKHYRYESDGVSWNVVDYEVKESSNIFKNKLYFREYSEGKVILIKFKYDNNKVKPSMEVIFEEIVDNFR